MNDLICFIAFRLTKIKEWKVPTVVYSASLHPDKEVFVCGGDDLRMYKFDYNTGAELGKTFNSTFKNFLLFFLSKKLLFTKVFENFKIIWLLVRFISILLHYVH